MNYSAHLLAKHFSIVEEQQNLSHPIRELNLSARSYNLLLSAKIQTLSDFIGISQEKLQKIDGLGKKSLEEIKEIRAKLNSPL